MLHIDLVQNQTSKQFHLLLICFTEHIHFSLGEENDFLLKIPTSFANT